MTISNQKKNCVSTGDRTTASRYPCKHHDHEPTEDTDHCHIHPSKDFELRDQDYRGH